MDVRQITPPTPPAWVRGLTEGPGSLSERWHEPGLEIARRRTGDWVWLDIASPAAGSLGPAPFQQRVEAAYDAAFAALPRAEGRQPVRCWNYVPAIHAGAGGGLDRYMVFNAGRLAALRRWCGPAVRCGRLATASGVGAPDATLRVQVLAMTGGARPIENPRQVPAYRYSRRYGPSPPGFARATQLTESPARALQDAVLIGGTASVVGEASRHPGDLAGQLEETCCNLAHLLEGTFSPATPDPLGQVHELRAYIVNPEHTSQVVARLKQSFANLQTLELCHTRLCRPELLVEVEGLAGPRLRSETLAGESPRRRTGAMLR